MKLDKAAIEAQAKRIMDSFVKNLGEQEVQFGVERDKQTREPKAVQPDMAFRQAFLENAPKTRDGLLLAEKKQW